MLEATFHAINIEYDHTSDSEIDDTKELQIEEALKLYQTALKYHAGGPASFEEAANAYKALFESDVFKYPESLSEGRRQETYGDGLEFDELLLQDHADSGVTPVVVPADAAPNTLPQILHLAYKNHGQFILDVLQQQVKERLAATQNDTTEKQAEVYPDAEVALGYFAEALDKDDADLDLWRASASVSRLVRSTRLERYCLEAVLDGDEDGFDSILSLPGIEEAFAAEQLVDLVKSLKDDLSYRTRPLSSVRHRHLSARWNKKLDPYPSILKPKFEDATHSQVGTLGKPPTRYIITLPNRDWSAIGEILLSQLAVENTDSLDIGSGVGIGFKLPETVTYTTQATIPIRPSPKIPQKEVLSIDSALVAQEQQPKKDEQDVDQAGEPSDSQNGQKIELAEKDVQMVDAQLAREDGGRLQDAEPVADDQPEESTARKRSTASADLSENADGGRIRSKRIRARETLDGNNSTNGIEADANKHFEAALQQYCDADDWLFGTLESIFENIQVDALGSSQSLRSIACPTSSTNKPAEDGEMLATAIRDMFDVSQNCTQENANVFMNGVSIDRLASTPIEYSLSSIFGMKQDSQTTSIKPLLDPSEGVDAWIEVVNNKWTYNKEAAWLWLTALVKSGGFPGLGRDKPSSYLMHRWPEELKKNIVQVSLIADGYIHERMADEVSELDGKIIDALGREQRYKGTTEDLATIEMAQTLFELHLDIYKRFKHPNSGIDGSSVTAQRHRLERWSILANTALNLRGTSDYALQNDELVIRHIWATAFHISTLDEVSQPHILAVMHDLKTFLISIGSPSFELMNNAVMPEISVAAVEQELSKMNIQGHFKRIFSHDDLDPVVVIDSLEPILELRSSPDCESEASIVSGAEANANPQDSLSANLPIREVGNFLAKGSVMLRLSLWQRLRMAYGAIGYQPKVILCHFESIEMLMQEFLKPSYRTVPKEARSHLLLRWLQIIDDLLQQILGLHKTASDPFEYMDVTRLRSSLNALQMLSRLLYTFNIYEDYVRVGQLPAPVADGRTKPAFVHLANKIYELQIRSWILQYLLLVEAISQDPESFPNPADNRLEFLRAVHYALGIRRICNRADRALLKLERDELLQLSDLEMSDFEMCQVLLDLYGLKLSHNPAELVDHRCNEVEHLTRGRAHKLVGFIMAQAGKVPMKDLPKTELKTSIDKVHGFLGVAKNKVTEDIQMNRRVLQQFLKGPVNPLDLFSALKGVLELPVKPVPATDAPAAAKGWYNLMANIALSKFKSQKRLQPGPTEDLNIAIAFFIQDLEYSSERWETWYRLGQCNDLQLEECVSWTAEKINSQSQDIQQYQRAAIHCYAMAISAATRNWDETPENKSALADLFYEFGLRMFSSSREPFSLRAFQFKEVEEKWFSGQLTGQDMYKRPPFRPLQLYTCWKFAAHLFRESIRRIPDNWLAHFMLGKCLWKMYSANESTRGSRTSPDMQEIITAFCNALEVLPSRKNKDPILEPHYKLVSIIHKLVRRKDLEPSRASAILQERTKYSLKPKPSEEMETWTSFILKVIGELKNADKSNWHHRMTARVSGRKRSLISHTKSRQAAHIVYEDSNGDHLGALGARHELLQQMFTKTMQIQVWRPDNERPGRHFVYTSRYLRFFMRVLVQLGDRPNLELLVRRLRRKPQEFYDHSKLWQETVLLYLKLLRRHGRVTEGHEEQIFKSLHHDDFMRMAERLETWCHITKKEVPALEALKEAIEMKRMNMGLMKATLIDDLICDTYAKLYDDNALAAFLDRDGDMPPFPSSQPGLPPPQQNASEPQTTKARNKGVGRREIMRKAELCVNRPVAATIASIPPRAPANTGGPLGQSVQVIISSRSGSTASLNNTAGNAPAGTSSFTTAGAGGGQSNGGPSHRGSLYESALDDMESGSELSEPPEDLEGEEPDFDEIADEGEDDGDEGDDDEKDLEGEVEHRAPLFPGLAQKNGQDSVGTGSPAGDAVEKREDGDIKAEPGPNTGEGLQRGE